ncbi:uncharacterized protein LOC133659299 [Entelurus aequoreus]|uniref:uncharacterized protein LOC133659299 n=1 Tax=Entelurus aequoreus TaxID=161455 RepID=UPI002B1D0A7F|nr:uncharacterized protein LOC133659299 [Entelurus aequoreus]
MSVFKAQQHHESPPNPPVFGKPWFWQRSSSTMESTRTLARVIMEMRQEIKKLEAENRALRQDQDQNQNQDQDQDQEVSVVMEENPSGNLRRNTSAPILKKHKDDNVMTVRRYSQSSSLPAVTSLLADEGQTDPDGFQEEIPHGTESLAKVSSSGLGDDSAGNRKSLQEYVQKNRAKMKTVTFLLPVEDIYTNRPALSQPHHSKISATDS